MDEGGCQGDFSVALDLIGVQFSHYTHGQSASSGRDAEIIHVCSHG
jgi:hypothetical protein